MQYKEIVFMKIKTEQPDKNRPVVIKSAPLHEALLKMKWSNTDLSSRVKESFLNYENMSIFNKGIILRELQPG